MPTSSETRPTACIALSDGSVFYGHGFGATGETVAELVFNTAMTGYQEIMTDPSYAGQVVTFTFPHIGNTGVTPEDDETATPVAAGMAERFKRRAGLLHDVGMPRRLNEGIAAAVRQAQRGVRHRLRAEVGK